ncbi:MAG: hypothetical protein PHV74_15070 [Dehalococcoidia bacterium]|nr:hypothetical protein [Dehalococcoidia bacterium]
MLVAGRPVGVAQLPPEELSLETRQEFYTVMASLSYSERRALARALFLKPSTIEGYRYHRRWPRGDVAKRVIEWNRQGKPIIFEKHEMNFGSL